MRLAAYDGWMFNSEFTRLSSCIGGLSGIVSRYFVSTVLNVTKVSFEFMYWGNVFQSLGPITANDESYMVWNFALDDRCSTGTLAHIPLLGL